MDEMVVESSRSGYIALMLLLPAVAVVNAYVHGSQLQAFLKRTPAFDTYQNIVDFEKVVARQMYAALVQIALLVAPGLVFLAVDRDSRSRGCIQAHRDRSEVDTGQ
jgi:hypothetical protein